MKLFGIFALSVAIILGLAFCVSANYGSGGYGHGYGSGGYGYAVPYLPPAGGGGGAGGGGFRKLS